MDSQVASVAEYDSVARFTLSVVAYRAQAIFSWKIVCGTGGMLLQAEPELLQFVDDDLKELVRERLRYPFSCPFSIESIEPFPVGFIHVVLDLARQLLLQGRDPARVVHLLLPCRLLSFPVVPESLIVPAILHASRVEGRELPDLHFGQRGGQRTQQERLLAMAMPVTLLSLCHAWCYCCMKWMVALCRFFAAFQQIPLCSDQLLVWLKATASLLCVFSLLPALCLRASQLQRVDETQRGGPQDKP